MAILIRRLNERTTPLSPPLAAVEYGIIDRVLEPEDEEVKRVVRAQPSAA